MQQRCPIEGCGRMFQNQLTMLEHVKRRHPQQSEKIRQQTTNQMLQKQNRIAQEMNKLPKMQKVIQMSKQKRPLQFQRRSASKKKIQLGSTIENSQVKLSEIISESRHLVDENSSSRKLLKRPSMSKKNTQQADKLPILAHSKIKKLKLQSLKSELGPSAANRQLQLQKQSTKNQSVSQNQSQSAMYSTAPNFTHQMSKKIDLIRSRGKKEGQISNRSSSKDIKQQNTGGSSSILHKKRLSSQTMQTLVQSEKALESTVKPMQRPIKRLLQRATKKDSTHSTLLTNQDLTQSTFVQKSQLISQANKQFTFQSRKRPLSKDDNRFSKKERSPGASPMLQASKQSTSLLSELNWHQRTVTIRNKQIQHLVIPQNSQVQYLYATNCSISSLDLNECFSLISLALNNNKLSSFDFLQPTINGSYQNLEALHLDHNSITSLDSLPNYLQLNSLSLTFNKIQGLDEVLKVLVKFPSLQELDLSFNSIRKQTNYKLAVIAACKNLKKLDGMVVTKFDRQMAAEYHKMYFDFLHIIPLSSSPISQDKFRPSTAVSINYQQQFEPQNTMSEMTEQQLQKQIQVLQKMIRNTKDQFQIIRQENMALQDEIQTYQGNLDDTQAKQSQFNPKIYKKLCKEVQELQMLNFLQYASQKELQQLLYKKIAQKGLTIQMLTVN